MLNFVGATGGESRRPVVRLLVKVAWYVNGERVCVWVKERERERGNVVYLKKDDYCRELSRF